MRAITKGVEPATLTAHRLTPYSHYVNYQDKPTLRRSLVTEQRGLCCYCMGRIRSESTSMKIEHWRSQASYPGEQLSYQNLLGACTGGHGQPEDFQHCDTRKGDKDLQWNPADAAHHIETRVRYEPYGSIHADDAVFNDQLNQVLNLNLPLLKRNRSGVLDAVLDWWAGEKARLRGPVSRERFERERDKYIAGNGQLAPYGPVAAWWLRQRLVRMGK